MSTPLFSVLSDILAAQRRPGPPLWCALALASA